MKIGLSYSRCVRDIVDGVVDINDVLVIISRTDFDPHDSEQWSGIWQGYHQRGGWSQPEWGHYAEEDEDRLNYGSLVSYISLVSSVPILADAQKFG